MGQRKNLRCFSFLLQTKPATRSSYCRIVYIMCKTSKVTVTFFTCQSLKWWILGLMQPASKCCISPGEWLGGKGGEPRGNAWARVEGKGWALLSYTLPSPSRFLSLAARVWLLTMSPLSFKSAEASLCGRETGEREKWKRRGGTMGLFPVSVDLLARKNIFIQLFKWRKFHKWTNQRWGSLN